MSAHVHAHELQQQQDCSLPEQSINDMDEDSAANLSFLFSPMFHILQDASISYLSDDEGVEDMSVVETASIFSDLTDDAKTLDASTEDDEDVASISIELESMSITSEVIEDFDSRGNFRQRRSMSLKTESLTLKKDLTANKKAVRFADAYGLDLVRVKMVDNLEEPPKIPLEATKHLNLPSDFFNNFFSHCLRLRLLPTFNQPFRCPNFLERVGREKVILESASQVQGDRISGSIRVANVAFNKTVFVRVSFNRWTSCQDVPAVYVQDSSRDFDKFAFSFFLPFNFICGDEVSLCVCFKTGSEEFWDNNFGFNYNFKSTDD